ncbi:hypothetical protein [Noviherbaspirillum denitrificans]|uniref:Uncharacterized protein n=1 Tax=Noviherbaspirillum denitrificans TaxID=1968433 RepID=A0A254TCY4_9BURK|nr:hypothetical protein [Noviherbaspirillum denitrificans]OWW18403.1 hypothetical protein AYR66_00965 [Noviherbaspirillum denitrificans]OWW19367.1 hypothetical protein AYR66_07450 [Noviherbaspirillum denitrificans]
MLIAFYRGKSRLFNRFVSWWTSGPYSHCEAVFELGSGMTGAVLCWSSSYMDGGVRKKVMTLDPEHWDLLDVPAMSGEDALRWFADHRGDGYDLVGLLATSAPFRQAIRKWFCNEAVGTAGGLSEAWRFNPNSFARICERLPGSRWIRRVDHSDHRGLSGGAIPAGQT